MTKQRIPQISQIVGIIVAVLGVNLGSMYFMIDGVREDIAQLEQSIDTLRRDMNTNDNAIRKEMTDGFTAVRKEMTDGFAAIRAEMTDGFANLRKDMEESDATIRENMNLSDTATRERIARIEALLESLLPQDNAAEDENAAP